MSKVSKEFHKSKMVNIMTKGSLNKLPSSFCRKNSFSWIFQESAEASRDPHLAEAANGLILFNNIAYSLSRQSTKQSLDKIFYQLFFLHNHINSDKVFMVMMIAK